MGWGDPKLLVIVARVFGVFCTTVYALDTSHLSPATDEAIIEAPAPVLPAAASVKSRLTQEQVKNEISAITTLYINAAEIETLVKELTEKLLRDTEAQDNTFINLMSTKEMQKLLAKKENEMKANSAKINSSLNALYEKILLSNKDADREVLGEGIAALKLQREVVSLIQFQVRNARELERSPAEADKARVYQKILGVQATIDAYIDALTTGRRGLLNEVQ